MQEWGGGREMRGKLMLELGIMDVKRCKSRG